MKDLKFHSRFSARIFGFALLTMLVTGIAAVPLRLAAQQAAPAAHTDTTAEPGAANAQQKQDDAFRLEGPVVKWTAKTFNLKVETAAEIFEITNFIIIVLGIGIPLFRILPKVLRKRKETLSESIESARKATAEANARLSAIEAQLNGLDAEIAKIRAQVEQESLLDEARIKASIEEESARIVVAAEQEISSAAAQATRALRHFAADLAIDQAARQLQFTPEIDRALIAEFAGDMGKGGKS